MYIWDALYGKIEFDTQFYRCMLSPEVQRLREIRLCNINSLCFTGSANTNRFEHSVGTAYLASVNLASNAAYYMDFSKIEKEMFVITALLHDVANGPFGHSYEYIMERQGFVPEKGIGDVLQNGGKGSYKQNVTFEPIYFGKMKTLSSILNSNQIEIITSIMNGEHKLSNLISAMIDLDNIDNVFRMAYHMGIFFTPAAPLILARSMYLLNGRVVFKNEAEPFLNEWFETRKKIYKFLLLNPQEFAGKYMLTEAMDVLFECAAEKKVEGKGINWYSTDYDLMTSLSNLKEVWLKRDMVLFDKVDSNLLSSIINDKAKVKTYLESLTLLIPIKEKGKSRDITKLDLDEGYHIEKNENDIIYISNRSMEFKIIDHFLYKKINTKHNPSQIISRLMTGDLYDCLMVLKTFDIQKYVNFLDYSQRVTIETDLETRIKSNGAFKTVSIGLHPILDVNKTERQLSVFFENSNYPKTIGSTASKHMLLGVFLKNEPFGLSHCKTALSKNREVLLNKILCYFDLYFEGGVTSIPLYEEANDYGSL